MPNQSQGDCKNKSKGQIYSDLVFRNIEKLVEDDLKDQDGQGNSRQVKRYKSLCKRSGGILRTVGLIQFLTFLAAKATKESEIHHHYFLEHLMSELSELSIVQTENQLTFLKIVRQQELPEYMRTTSETLKLLQWHKRISDILIIGTVEED